MTAMKARRYYWVGLRSKFGRECSAELNPTYHVYLHIHIYLSVSAIWYNLHFQQEFQNHKRSNLYVDATDLHK
jgi:hypothetical protein